MQLDSLLEFSSSQAITAAAASQSIIDLVAVRRIGEGTPLYVCVCVEVAFTDGSSDSTLTVDLQTDSTSTITPDGSHTLGTLPALAAIGKYFFPLPMGAAAMDYEFAQLYYTPNNGNLSTGTISAFITSQPDNSPRSYADNSQIS